MKRNLHIFLTVLGAVMLGAGLAGVFLGVRTVLEPGSLNARVDSEMRFFAVWYATAGLFLLRGLRQPDGATEYIQFVAGAFFFGGCARALSWATVGAPHPSQIALMVIELALPLIILPWQKAAARRDPSTESA